MSAISDLHREVMVWLGELPDRIRLPDGTTVHHRELRAVLHEVLWSVRFRGADRLTLRRDYGQGAPAGAIHLADLARVKRQRVSSILAWLDELELTTLHQQHGMDRATVRTVDPDWSAPGRPRRAVATVPPGASGVEGAAESSPLSPVRPVVDGATVPGGTSGGGGPLSPVGTSTVPGGYTTVPGGYTNELAQKAQKAPKVESDAALALSEGDVPRHSPSGSLTTRPGLTAETATTERPSSYDDELLRAYDDGRWALLAGQGPRLRELLDRHRPGHTWPDEQTARASDAAAQTIEPAGQPATAPPAGRLSLDEIRPELREQIEGMIREGQGHRVAQRYRHLVPEITAAMGRTPASSG